MEKFYHYISQVLIFKEQMQQTQKKQDQKMQQQMDQQQKEITQKTKEYLLNFGANLDKQNLGYLYSKYASTLHRHYTR